MSLAAFDGGAGSGKTYSVMELLAGELEKQPLLPHQRVVALTFMHGARHRLDEKLENIAALRGRYDAMTLDSFAWTICRRWRSRLREQGKELPDLEEPNVFDIVCNLAADLAADVAVSKWVANYYPFILIDEAQDLDGGRLKLVEHLLGQAHVFLAFDEFQCLNPKNRPVAVVGWIGGRCEPKVLSGCRRTSESDLLKAAAEIRGGQAITASGSSFGIKVAPANKTGGPALAASLTAFELAKGGTCAILSPARPSSSPYVAGVLELVRTRTWGKHSQVGPYPVRWEGGEEQPISLLREQLKAKPTHSFGELVRLLGSAGLPAAAQLVQQVRRIRAGRGQEEFETSLVEKMLDRQIILASQFTRRPLGRLKAMTIHQAKNREFDRVIVLWPYQIPATADDRRRLLYNAITRAKRSCLVLVQSNDLATQSPFT